MNITFTRRAGLFGDRRGFGIVDAMVGMAIVGVCFGALYSGLAFGFKVVQFARENTRATQILVQQMETVRLLTWNQLTNTNPNFIATGKTNIPYYAVGTNLGSIYYTQQIFVASSGLSTSYAADMKKVTVQLHWSTGKQMRTRSISTFVSRNGMQNYVYN